MILGTILAAVALGLFWAGYWAGWSASKEQAEWEKLTERFERTVRRHERMQIEAGNGR